MREPFYNIQVGHNIFGHLKQLYVCKLFTLKYQVH